MKSRWLCCWRKEFCIMFCSFQCSRNCLENCVVCRRISISQLENIVSKLESLFYNMWKEHGFKLFGVLLGPVFKVKIQKHLCKWIAVFVSVLTKGKALQLWQRSCYVLISTKQRMPMDNDR